MVVHVFVVAVVVVFVAVLVMAMEGHFQKRSPPLPGRSRRSWELGPASSFSSRGRPPSKSLRCPSLRLPPRLPWCRVLGVPIRLSRGGGGFHFFCEGLPPLRHGSRSVSSAFCVCVFGQPLDQWSVQEQCRHSVRRPGTVIRRK